MAKVFQRLGAGSRGWRRSGPVPSELRKCREVRLILCLLINLFSAAGIMSGIPVILSTTGLVSTFKDPGSYVKDVILTSSPLWYRQSSQVGTNGHLHWYRQETEPAPHSKSP